MQCKRFLAALVGLAVVHVASPALAVPALMAYDGQLVNSGDGSPVAGPVDITVSIFDAASGGGLLFEQGFSGVALDDGYFHLMLDTNEVPAGDPLDLLGLANALFLELDVEGTVLTPRQQLASVPWSFSSNSPQNIDETGCQNGEVLEYSDGTFYCATGGGGGGGISEVVAGDGLNGGGTTSSVSLAVDTSVSRTGHEHNGADITTGTVPFNRLPVGSTSTTVARGNHTHSAGTLTVRTNLGTSTDATVLCPSLAKATGGGCETIAANTSNQSSFVKASYPVESDSSVAEDGDVPVGWYCSCAGINWGASPPQLQLDCDAHAFAICQE